MSPNKLQLDQKAISINSHGWCAEAVHRASPNCDARPAGKPLDLLVIHGISLPPGEFGGPYIEALFQNRLDCDVHPYFDGLRTTHVSAHFLIRRDGSLLQFVSTLQRAWHAGVSEFAGQERCNDFSIGIEVEGSDDVPFEAAQYASLAVLTVALKNRHALSNVVGHEHIAAGRKSDPGPFFDWALYHSLYAAYCNRSECSASESALPLYSESTDLNHEHASVLRFFSVSSQS
jgi:AmpD protein